MGSVHCACRAYGFRAHRLDRRPDKAKPPSGTKAGMAPEVSSPAVLRLPGLGYMGLRGAGDIVIDMQLY